MRISIVGTAGSGKSTLAAELGRALGVPVIDLDVVNWQAGWRALNLEDPEEFQRRVSGLITADNWIIEGNYGFDRNGVLARADQVIWLDYPRRIIMSRVIRRSFGRALGRKELWPGTGNREHFLRWLRRDHPIRWAWDTMAMRHRDYPVKFAQPEFAHLAVHRLRHPRDKRGLVARVKAAAGL